MIDRARYTELDIAKGLGIFFMILVHVSGTFSPNTNRVVSYLGRFPAAPVFMFALGTGIIFTRHNTTRELAHRGIALFVFSYIYNFLAYVLPDLLMRFFDTTMNSFRMGLVECLSNLICVDILQFGGLAFLYFALVKKLRLGDRQILLLSVLISVVGTILRYTTSIQGVTAQALLGLFWGTSPDITFFPFSSWIIYPTAGYLFAKHILPAYSNKTRMYLFLGLAGGAMYIVLSVLTSAMHISFANFGVIDAIDADYYHMHTIGNICVLAFLLAWISVCYTFRILPAPIIGMFRRWSKHITPIYVIHMIMIHYLVYCIPYGLSTCETVVLSFVILVASDLLISLWEAFVWKWVHRGGARIA